MHTKWTEWGMKCVLKQGTWGFPFLWVCVCVHISTQSHDLHLQIKNNILVWTLGTDSETNKLQVQTWNESKIEFHFRIHICPHRIVQCLRSRRNRSVFENLPTVPEQFRPDQTGDSVLKTPHWINAVYPITDHTTTEHNTTQTLQSMSCRFWHLWNRFW